MLDLLRILTVLAVLVTLLRRRVYLGTVMLVGALLLALLYLTPPLTFLGALYRGVFSARALEMTAVLVGTMIMEHVLRTSGTLQRMVASLSAAISDTRVVMAAMPAMIGMLPSPGGAVFSAPLVAAAAGRLEMPADQKAFVNYWYRHIWEYVSPLYPGIILAAGLTGLPYASLALANAPYALSVVVWGALFGFRGLAPLPGGTMAGTGRRRALLEFVLSVAPIFLTLLLVLLRVNLILAMGGVIVALFLHHRYSLRQVATTLRESVSLKALFLVSGILVFQETLQVTGALAAISRFFTASGLPPLLIVTTVPFLAGVMTGLTVAYVGITLPILLPLLGGGTPHLGLVSLAFASGFAGVMLSPLHLCLVLTREYFAADLGLVYRRLWWPSALVLAAALFPLWFWP